MNDVRHEVLQLFAREPPGLAHSGEQDGLCSDDVGRHRYEEQLAEPAANHAVLGGAGNPEVECAVKRAQRRKRTGSVVTADNDEWRLDLGDVTMDHFDLQTESFGGFRSGDAMGPRNGSWCDRCTPKSGALKNLFGFAQIIGGGGFLLDLTSDQVKPVGRLLLLNRTTPRCSFGRQC